MNVTSANKDIEDYISNFPKAQNELGQKRAKTLQKRLEQMLRAHSLEDLRIAPGHFYELTDNRKGQWACDLDHPYRLIFTAKEQPIPTDPNGRYIWIEIKAIELIEITNYHGK